jgi:hypothetical protein
MPLYQVSLFRTVHDLLTCTLEIEAPDEDTAAENRADLADGAQT